MSITKLFRIVPVLFVFCFLALTADHPPSGLAATACEHSHNHSTSYYGGCALHEGFVPIPHTGRRYLLYLVDRLAPAAGEDPAIYSVDIIRETSGPEYINAMTCSDSKVIWVSRKAYQELFGYEPALAYLVAHEIAHGSSRSVFSANRDWRYPAEERLYKSLTGRQRHEVVVDQRAADIMLAAGYSQESILAGARYILWQDGADLVLAAGPSHPGGWDRATLLSYYLARQAVSAPAVAGRVLPR
ncbi:MAG: hypothetical protein AAF597_03515 [Bacteroidota bacterium]